MIEIVSSPLLLYSSFFSSRRFKYIKLMSKLFKNLKDIEKLRTLNKKIHKVRKR